MIGFYLGLSYNGSRAGLRTCPAELRFAVGDYADRGGEIMEGLLQPIHLFFILLIVLILFGPGKLPELGKGLGKGIKEFKDAIRGGLEGSSEKK